MKDKEKQIEEMEMAREIHKALLECKNNSRCSNCEFKNDTPMSFCKAEYIAKAIREHYQPILPKDSIVLSREEKQEYEGLVKLLIYDKPIKSRVYEFIKDTKEQASKETAEKFLQLVYDRVIDKHFIKKAEEIAKQFGVEIKE